MVRFSFLGSVTVLVVLLGVAQAWTWSDLGNSLRLQPRELQNDIFNLCGAPFENGRRSHLLTNLNKKGKSVLDWVPPEGENFNIVVDVSAGTLTLFGPVIPKGEDDLENVMTVSFTYSVPAGIDQCYCASDIFLDNGGNIYDKIEDDCTYKNYADRPEEAESLLFCPTCEENQCKIASRNDDAPDPIFADWTFYRVVGGSLSGPGLALFRRTIAREFASYDVNENINSCTPDIANQPLPQLHCTDYMNPEEGFGWGVNGKNQNCGFSSWFNCEEDVQIPAGVRVADINLDLVECIEPIFPPPTSAPTAEPTAAPTPCPFIPCKVVEVCVPCKYFPDDMNCGMNMVGPD